MKPPIAKRHRNRRIFRNHNAPKRRPKPVVYKESSILSRIRGAARLIPCGKCGYDKIYFTHGGGGGIPTYSDWERGRCANCHAKIVFCLGCNSRLPELDGMMRAKVCLACEETPPHRLTTILHVGNRAPVVPLADRCYHGGESYGTNFADDGD